MLTKALNYYHERGGRALAARLLRAIWHTEEYIVYHKETCDCNCPSHYGDVVFRTIGMQEIPWVAANWPSHLGYVGPHVNRVISARLRAGDIGVVGVPPQQDTKLIFLSWCSRRDFALLTVLGERLGRSEACTKNLWVHEGYRRQGIALRGQRYLEGLASRQGVKRVWGFVMRGNTASQVLLRKLGYDMHGKIRFVERFGTRYAEVIQEESRRRLRWCPPGMSHP